MNAIVMDFRIFTLFVLYCIRTIFGSRSFTVDYENNTFLKDGKPFRYVSGSIHYFRVPPEFWHDRIYKMKMAGLNAIQTYVEWNHHEPEPGVYNFEGNYDLVKFVKTAQDLDMLVILRTGPFIDAERDMGGLPYWLLRIDPNMQMRFYDPNFIKYIDQWYNVLLPKIEPLLYNNGGPIITIQIENEYGFCGCDQYKAHLRDLFNKLLKKNAVLFTTDQPFPNSLACGKTYNVLATTDFGAGANITLNFDRLRYTQADGPLVNSEYYPGYLDHWGHPHSTKTTENVVKTLNEMLLANASVNFYMFHGGTSFGFTAGSNILDTFQACPTSYDYDAPLTEAGDPTPKYYAIRDTIGKFFPLPPGPVPQPAPKMKSPLITLKKVMSVWDYIAKLNNSIVSTYPLSFEKLYHPFGFILYKTIVQFRPTDPAVLTVKNIADRGYVYVNKVLQGVLSREQKVERIPVQVLKGQEIEIIVENQGRVCAGAINDQKGIFQNVTLGSKILQNWTMIPIPLDPKSIQKIESFTGQTDSVATPSFYTGEFQMPSSVQILDTFLKVDGWHKGVAFLNQFNLGRYWPIIGPQLTLYSPSTLFQNSSTVNRITLFELENSPCDKENSCVVQFVDIPIVDGPTPEY
ncbi:beta-galactosidase-like isoform X1 [Argiope bruennichi]|uniref:beta-galactosidase-like isoform X1 n=1 Tax=Argiope bruennichi TaxID=94029 RepID=UPI00249572B8|nr:beta-galactosidase-like isoform X1 [Argiope bruennichi]